MQHAFARFLVAAAPLLTIDVPAQDAPPKSAPELKRLGAFAGTWHGEGTVVMQAGLPPAKWSGTWHCEWVLGGFWLRTDAAFHFQGMGDMRIREYLGWDTENGRYVLLSVNNMGEGSLTTPHIEDDGGIVQMLAFERDGQPQCERVATRRDGDGWTVTSVFLGVEGAAEERFRGRLEPGEERPGPLAEAGPLFPADQMPGHADMAKLARLAGRYAFEGEVVTEPGKPPMKIRGEETFTKLFGGSIIHAVGKAHPGGMEFGVETQAFYAWNARERCFSTLYVNSMGDVGEWHTRFADDDALVSVFAGWYRGAPTTRRFVMDLDDQGRPTTGASHLCSGTDAPAPDYKGVYRRVE
ncbi:MAG: DUF1579 family protein [Planctomycetota bacterium]